MPDPVIPDDVLRLLREDLHGYAALETLILISSEPHRDWTAAQISADLRIAEVDVEQALGELVSCDLAVGPDARGSFNYRIRDDTRAHAVKALRRVYDEHRIEIVRAMNRNAIERVRNSAARAFADAFVLGRKKDG